MKRLDWSTLDAAGRIEALARPRRRTEARVSDTVREIMEDVRTRGGGAVTDWSLKLDGAAPRLELTPDPSPGTRRPAPADTRHHGGREHPHLPATRRGHPDVGIPASFASRLATVAFGGPLCSRWTAPCSPVGEAVGRRRGIGRRIAVTRHTLGVHRHDLPAAEPGSTALADRRGPGDHRPDLRRQRRRRHPPCDKLFGLATPGLPDQKQAAAGGPAVDASALERGHRDRDSTRDCRRRPAQPGRT
jgi:histidinol dehydrogenase